MTRPVHTPYDGSSTPFTIGLRPFDPRDWIEPGDDLEAGLAEKDRLFREVPGTVFMARPDTFDAQREVLDALVAYLPERFPEIYRFHGGAMNIGDSGRRVRLERDDQAPLRTASLLVAEDLVLMRRCDDGWRLVAASLCFPSSWSLAEMFDCPMQVIHTSVPAFGPGTRIAELINRIFDNLRVELPAERLNWSLQDGDALHHPQSRRVRIAEGDTQSGSLAPRAADRVHLRVERQTLRRLPVSGDLLFTIRIHLDPLSALRGQDVGSDLALGLKAQLLALNADQLGYKGFAEGRDRIAAWLEEAAAERKTPA